MTDKRSTATILHDLGHHVLQAHSGHEALELLSREHADVMITDYAMPSMTGGELIEKSARAPSAPLRHPRFRQRRPSHGHHARCAAAS